MKEEEIRPKTIFEEYLNLSRQDAEAFERALFKEVGCPGCGEKNSKPQFDKDGFNYVFCEACGSLYCSPRPSENELADFYKNSKSAKYWAEVFFPSVAEIRRKKIFMKKAKQLYEVVVNKKLSPMSICDVGAGYGIFLEELSPYFSNCDFFAIEPSPELAEICRSKGFETYQGTSEQSAIWKERFDLVISSEVVEHVYSCDAFIESLNNLIRPGGYCLLTGLGYEGFDILTLGEQSNSVSPPHHLNFLSIRGFESLFRRNGFSMVEIWTPGKLDVDIVINSSHKNEFIRVLEQRGEKTIREFQTFLQKHKLSSHVWILAKK